MTADFERRIDRWLTEFDDDYLSEFCINHAWREVKDRITFSFTYQIVGATNLYISFDIPVSEVEEIPDSLTFAQILQEKFTAELLNHFYKEMA